jgi:RNA polymerase sigma factor (sigma-70 family)
MEVPVTHFTPAAFPFQTAWSVVLGAADRTSPEWKTRLESLIQRYWRPVYAYLIRRWNCSPQDAADLTQDFFAGLFEEDFLHEASPERGRFRTFLKLKLKDLVLHEFTRRSAQKRGGGTKILSIDRADADRAVELQWPGLTPEEEFDRVWAVSVLSQAMEELRKKLTGEGREAVFKAFWNCTAATPPQTYRRCADELGLKVNDVGNFVFRARAELRKILRQNVREIVDREGDDEQELNYILRLLEE